MNHIIRSAVHLLGHHALHKITSGEAEKAVRNGVSNVLNAAGVKEDDYEGSGYTVHRLIGKKKYF